MTAKQLPNSGVAPDGSEYVTLTDGAGDLVTISGGGGDASAANQTSQITQETAINTVLGVKTDAKSTATDTTAVSSVSIWKQISASVQAMATALAATIAVTQSGTWTVQPGNTANTTAWLTTPKKPTTGTQSTVASSATSVTVLASNASRLGATVYNDSTAILYLSNSATAASTTAYSVQLAGGAYYEVPFGYTGQLTGIWASATGNARVSELT